MAANPTVTLTQVDGYQFLVDFGLGTPELLVDEPPPHGAGGGPTPGRLLLAGMANCLVFSLLTALAKYNQQPKGLSATATLHTERNAEGRIRITEVTVTLRLGQAGGEVQQLDEILRNFETFSTVSQSVQQGIALKVCVDDSLGVRLKG